MFKILSLDGGGIRGIYAAALLQKFESSSAPLSKCFDLIAGTSTGGIIALALGFGHPMEEVVKLYSDHAPLIFPPARLKHAAFIRNFFSAKYCNKPLIKKLQEVFGKHTLFEDPECRLRVQSYDLSIGEPRIFRASATEPDLDDSQYRVWEVAAATSAAPTFFRTFHSPGKGHFVDGGIWANNPALVAIMEAVKLGHPLHQIRVLSIGTGKTIFRISKVKTGFLSWLPHIVEMNFQSQSGGVEELISSVSIDSIIRLNAILKPEEAALDNIKSVEPLLNLAENDARKYRKILREQFFFASR